MKFQGRVLIGLAGLLVLTLLGVWLIISAGVLRPMIGSLLLERADVALHIARQVEEAEDPRSRLRDLEEMIEVKTDLKQRKSIATPPPRGGVMMRRRGRDVHVFRGGNHFVVPVTLSGERHMLSVRFPVDLDAPHRNAGLGLFLVLFAGLLAAWGVSRWMRKPLELVIAGMQRIADGDLDHRLAGGGDVTGRIGDTFNQMADRLQGMVQGQRQLMAAVSHEVRTPLARMRIQTELLRDSGADEKRVTAMEGEIAEVDELIGELLESARLDQGILILDLCEIDLRDLAMNALGSLDLGEHPVTLSIPPGLRVRGDNRRILRAVSNLLSNVVRYTPPQTPVSIDMAEEDHGVRIAVSDEGPGVDPVDLSRLFDPFFRAEESRSRVTGGLGVGLMLVRQIARAHGGWVRAENREGGGLVVTLWFPSTHSDQSSSSSM